MKCLVDVKSTNEAFTLASTFAFDLPDRYTDSKVGEKSLGLGKMSDLQDFKRVYGFDFTTESLHISKLTHL